MNNAQPPPKTKSDLIHKAAERTGLDSASIGQVYLQLQQLRREGILLDVDVRGTTMFTRRASLAELGIPRVSLRGKTISPGQKHLIPKKVNGRVQSLAQRLRDALNKYAQDVTGFRPYRYLRYSAYDPFTTRWGELIAEWCELKELILENLDDWRDLYLENEAKRALEAWAAIMATNGQHKVLIINLSDTVSKTFEHQDEFVDWLVERASPIFPTHEKVETGLVADYKTAIMVSQADISAELERSETAAAHAADAQANQVESHERERVARSEAQLKMAAIRQAELEHAREQIASVASPFDELFTNLRAWAFNEAREMAASIHRNGFFNPQVAKRMTAFMEMFQMKDATDDQEISQLLIALREKANAAPKQTGKAGQTLSSDPVAVAELETALADIVAATHEAARDVARRNARAGDIAALEM